MGGRPGGARSLLRCSGGHAELRVVQCQPRLRPHQRIGARYRRSYPYWLIDEFQDTNSAQYALIRALAGEEFRNIFAVADDDQIIYEWNGASFKQIQAFLSNFAADAIQLPTNYRCPPAIVEAANRLVGYNAQRTGTKKPLVAGKKELKFAAANHIQLRAFPDDEAEAQSIAAEIFERGRERWGQTAVLGRTRALLDRMRAALGEQGVAAVVAQRRDDFLSPEFRWLVSGLKQATRPLDRRNIAVVVDAFNRIAGSDVAVD